MPWSLRYSFHAGYDPNNFRPQFLATLGTDDPVALVHFAAEQGVAGVLYPWAADRAQDEIDRVSAALAETGLAGSCVVIGDASVIFGPIWTDRSPAGHDLLTTAVERACINATALRATTIVAFPIGDPARADQPARQRDDLVANLTAMARLANGYGVRIGVEPMLLPGLMLQSLDSALDVTRRVASRDVGIVFDTAHIATLGGDLLANFREAYDDTVLLQFADLPGRVEPGAGQLDLIAVGAEAIARGYTGMVDLEHGWLDPSAQGEIDGFARLRRFDERVHAAVAQHHPGERDVAAVGR